MMQIALPRRSGPPDYDRVLRYSICLRVPGGSTADAPLQALDWDIIGFSQADRDPEFRGRGSANAEALITEFLQSPTPTEKGVPAKPAGDLLDFDTYSGTLVVIRLFGDFWQMASPMVTSKAAQPEPGYVEACGYGLRKAGGLTRVDAYGGPTRRCSALAFEVAKTMPKRAVGLNFHVEFLGANPRQGLPVIIDPTGGNGGPPPGGPG